MRRPKKTSGISSLAIIVISALTGFIALAIAFSALSLGLWIDGLVGQRGPATVCLVVASVPLSLFIMIRLALFLIKRFSHKPRGSTYAVDDTIEDEVPFTGPLEHKEE